MNVNCTATFFREHKPEPTDDPTEALPEASFFVEVDLETLD